MLHIRCHICLAPQRKACSHPGGLRQRLKSRLTSPRGVPVTGKKAAILVESACEDLEFWYPYYRMKEEGAQLTAVGAGSSDVYRGKHGPEAKPDMTAAETDPKEFGTVVIPGGYAPDYTRRDPALLGFVKEMNDQGKVVAAICHAGWVLVSADLPAFCEEVISALEKPRAPAKASE